MLFLPFGENVSKIDRDLRHAARVGIESNLRAILGELDPVRRNDNEFERARHIVRLRSGPVMSPPSTYFPST